MELQLQKYTATEILNAYTFAFAQYLAIQMCPIEGASDILAPEWLQLCIKIRKGYLERSDAEEEQIIKIEKDCSAQVTQVSQMINLPQERLMEAYKEKLMEVENILKNKKR